MIVSDVLWKNLVSIAINHSNYWNFPPWEIAIKKSDIIPNERKSVIYIKDNTAVQQLVLLPRSKKVVSSIQRTSCLLSVGALPVLQAHPSEQKPAQGQLGTKVTVAFYTCTQKSNSSSLPILARLDCGGG